MNIRSTTRVGPLAVGLCALAGACSLDADPPPTESITTAEIKNGTVWDPWTQTTQTWTRNVVRVGGCTGTLLDYEWVLTAGHCFKNGTATDPTGIVVRHTLADGTIETANGAELIFHPQSDVFTGTNDGNVDAALVRIDRPFHPGIGTLPLVGGTTDDLVGQTVFCAGYGAIATGGSCSTSADCASNQFCKFGACMTKSDGKLRTAWFSIIEDDVDPSIWYQFAVPNALGQMELPGDSGSSCWNGAGLTGVAKAANASSYNRHTSTPAFRDWVKQIVTPSILRQVNKPAAACKAAGGPELDVDANGLAFNAAATTAIAVCPIARPIAPAVADVVGVPKLWVLDRHPTLDVCCLLQSKNPTGALIRTEQVCSSGNQAGVQELVLPSIFDPFSFSQFSIQCSIPPTSTSGASGIHGYRAITADR